MQLKNIYGRIPDDLPEELFETLLRTGHFEMQRIVSEAHATPPGKWYDEEKAEWVILLQGGAGLYFEAEGKMLVMKPGDFVNIPAHCRHRVEWTDPNCRTVWLAVIYTQ